MGKKGPSFNLDHHCAVLCTTLSTTIGTKCNNNHNYPTISIVRVQMGLNHHHQWAWAHFWASRVGSNLEVCKAWRRLKLKGRGGVQFGPLFFCDFTNIKNMFGTNPNLPHGRFFYFILDFLGFHFHFFKFLIAIEKNSSIQSSYD